MKKYWCIFSIYWQEALTRRATFLVERFRALVVLVSFYYFWDAILRHRSSFAGYDRHQILTYVLGMHVLKSLIFATRTEEITAEINHGRLSSYLLKPVNFMFYTLFKDLSEKSINLVSSVCEVCGLIWLFKVQIVWPSQGTQWLAFLATVLGAMWLYFIISFATGCGGFWTSETWGPRFVLELFLEFTAGTFFPLDVLPKTAQQIFMALPSPYLIFFPLQIFLGKLDSHQIVNGILVQILWISLLSVIARWVWNKGLRVYSAAGS